MKPKVQKLVNTLLQKMNRKFLNMEDNMLLVVPTLLDPRFKKMHFRILVLQLVLHSTYYVK